MTKNIIGFLFISMAALGPVVLTACDSSRTTAVAPLEKLTVGTYEGDLSALFWVAKDRGYFTKHGVEVEFKTRESGLESYMDLLDGKVDLATMTEFVFVSKVLEHPELRILAVVGQTNTVKLVARKDRGITQVSDLQNKRIGLVRGSIADYHLHLFLLTHHLPLQDSQLVDLTPSEQAKAIAQGDVDAVIVWEPFVRQILIELGQNAVSWPAQSGQDFYWLLVCREDTVRKHSSALRDVLGALASAEDFMKNHKIEAKGIVASQIGAKHMPEVWDTSRFELTLGRPEILAMESELRWMNSMHGLTKFEMPDLLDYIYFDALDAIKPEKVKMLH